MQVVPPLPIRTEPGGWVATLRGMNETAGLGCLVGGGNPARCNEATIPLRY
jgi:hypothetical protein